MCAVEIIHQPHSQAVQYGHGMPAGTSCLLAVTPPPPLREGRGQNAAIVSGRTGIPPSHNCTIKHQPPLHPHPPRLRCLHQGTASSGALKGQGLQVGFASGPGTPCCAVWQSGMESNQSPVLGQCQNCMGMQGARGRHPCQPFLTIGGWIDKVTGSRHAQAVQTQAQVRPQCKGMALGLVSSRHIDF